MYDELRRRARDADKDVLVIEGAGGVLSPAPSGTPQADLYRPFRLPVLLVGDHKLGGIGTTISAWESLHVRGYDVQGVALFSEDRYNNHSYLKPYFAERGVDVMTVEAPPTRRDQKTEDFTAMNEYYRIWSQNASLENFTNDFLQAHDKRIEDVKTMPYGATQHIWHPFLQHRERSADNIVAIDSAYGDFFQTYTSGSGKTACEDSADAVLTSAFDGSASWWTQGLGHGNPRLALTAAHAAGRYGHVMFASAVHEPALTLAKTLIESSGNPRLSKVFYTDNGSTGMEVAVKMALRAAAVRNGWSADERIDILGLTNSYHGDTIGTMDCSEPSVFNKKVEWYSGRGHWLDFPQVKMRRGKWLVEGPEGVEATSEFTSLDQIFDFERRSDDRRRYRAQLDDKLASLRKEGVKLGALILEPIILGAGGMMFADPLFQRCLVDAVRETTGDAPKSDLDWSGIPVIFDEVFTGLYRLGSFSAASLLGVDPDIVVNAKLLTGGLLPLCTTTASEAIFDAFLSDDKSDALLHGHSYTAHAVGCAVANESLAAMTTLASDGSWDGFRDDWRGGGGAPVDQSPSAEGIWSMWSQSFVKELSHKPHVESVFALGSVLSISLADPEGSGYASKAATGFRDALLGGNADDTWVIHSRVLGNVLYLMAAMNTSPKVLRGVQERVLRSL